MSQKSSPKTSPSERLVRDICRDTRKQYSAEDKNRIVLDGLRGELFGVAYAEGFQQYTGTPCPRSKVLQKLVGEALRMPASLQPQRDRRR